MSPEALAEVYKHDGQCRQDKLSPEQRLSFHQAHSKPVMDELARWMAEDFKQRRVEPNSGLGKALRYLIGHWEALTLFLRKAGAPLDNSDLADVVGEVGANSSTKRGANTVAGTLPQATAARRLSTA